MHKTERNEEFTCDLCKCTFVSKHHLRQHETTKHVKPNISNEVKVNCDFCGIVANSQNDLAEHKRECNAEFQRVRNKTCKYFVNGGCFKGELCLFAHPPEKQFKAASNCRNGPRCSYLANGVCRFFHRGVGVQQPPSQQQHGQHDHEEQQPRKWCKFLEDCYRVPNCSFFHYQEDFPELTKTNNPPLGEMNKGAGWWQDY